MEFFLNSYEIRVLIQNSIKNHCNSLFLHLFGNRIIQFILSVAGIEQNYLNKKIFAFSICSFQLIFGGIL